MNLNFDTSLSSGYKSASQIARVLTEAWFDEEMYCPACSSDELERLPDNTKVKDFHCPVCEETYQLKSKSRSFGNRVANSEYHTKIEKIKKGLSPNWSFLRYDIDEYKVIDLMIIPKHFMTLDAVEKRKPLSDDARRSGWVGSNILLNRFPPDAKLIVVEDGEVRSRTKVRKQWKKFEFMKKKRLESKGWLNDVLTCVRELEKEEFTLQEMYGFVDRLSKMHPENEHVEAKIRQQLQVLRNEGILEFLDYNGTYRINL